MLAHMSSGTPDAAGRDAHPPAGDPAVTDAPAQGNWGRWGPADERGLANLLTPECVVSAARLVRSGKVYPLGLEVAGHRALGPPERRRADHLMRLDAGDYALGLELDGGFRYAEDVVNLPCHDGTHIDALSHVWTGDALYNGHPAAKIHSRGAARCGIEKLGGVVTRGVLLDLAAHDGVEHLAGGREITPADLDACAAAGGLTIGAGDAVLLRTGWQSVLERSPEEYHACCPGIGPSAARELARRDVCLVGSDTIVVEVIADNGRYAGGAEWPVVHPMLIRDHGMYLVELLSLDDLANAGGTEFLLVIAPLLIRGGTASPVNPIAIC